MVPAARVHPATLIIAVVLGVLGAAVPGCASQPPVEDRAWLVTVYYTAVESFHRDQPERITGCRAPNCQHGTDELGWYPRGFATAVRDEGTGRITSGQHAGRYLNWSHDVGYWLDDAPRDAHGRPLEPLRSAAADGLPDGTRLALLNCGRLDSGDPVPDEVCQTLRDAPWEIRDQFTPGLGGDNHIDLYIGEESEPNYTTSGALYVTLTDARFRLRT
jgi:hypothetical protein